MGRVGFSKELFVFGGWGLDWFWLFLCRGGTLCKRLIYLFIFGMGGARLYFFFFGLLDLFIIWVGLKLGRLDGLGLELTC